MGARILIFESQVVTSGSPPPIRCKGVAPGNSCRPWHVRNRVHYTDKRSRLSPLFAQYLGIGNLDIHPVIDSIGCCSFVTQRESKMACLFRVQGVCTSRPPRIHRTATWLGSVVMLLATIHPSAHGLAIADQEKTRPNSCVTAEPDSAGSNDMLFLKYTEPSSDNCSNRRNSRN
jgi:hypothetical protein